MDVDRFKHLNDTYGHVAGDQALCLAVSRIAAQLRPQDVVARYGGDEFIVLLSGAAHTEAAALAERLRMDIEGMRLSIPGVEASVTVSVGVASSAELEPTDEPSALVALADARLYDAKAQGRNRVRA
jgi:diguanylate cyclase (GGDEF)-like protein